MNATALPSMSLELVDEYLKAANVSALHVWGAHGGEMTMFEALREPARKRPPRGLETVATFWMPGSSSVQVRARCRDALTGGDFVWRGNWVFFPSAKAAAIVEHVAGRLDVALVPDVEARARIAPRIAAIESVFQRRRESGDLRGLNKDYRILRLNNPGLRKFPTWGAYVRGLRVAAAHDEARREGAAVILGARS